MDLHDRIETHPGMCYYRALKAYGHSKSVLFGNSFEVLRFIQVLESKEIENKLGYDEYRKVFHEFDGHLVRYLHNFLSSAMSLISHTRVLMRSSIISSAHRARYQSKVSEHFGGSESAKFVQGFRNYFLHYGIPSTIHHTTFSPKIRCEILIDMEELGRWENWTSEAKKFISAHCPTMRLFTLVSEYERVAGDFHNWFVHDFAQEYSTQLAELKSLQKEWNNSLGVE